MLLFKRRKGQEPRRLKGDDGLTSEERERAMTLARLYIDQEGRLIASLTRLDTWGRHVHSSFEIPMWEFEMLVNSLGYSKRGEHPGEESSVEQ